MLHAHELNIFYTTFYVYLSFDIYIFIMRIYSMSCIHCTVPCKLLISTGPALGAARASGCQSIPEFQGRCGAPIGVFFGWEDSECGWS